MGSVGWYDRHRQFHRYDDVWSHELSPQERVFIIRHTDMAITYVNIDEVTEFAYYPEDNEQTAGD